MNNRKLFQVALVLAWLVGAYLVGLNAQKGTSMSLGDSSPLITVDGFEYWTELKVSVDLRPGDYLIVQYREAGELIWKEDFSYGMPWMKHAFSETATSYQIRLVRKNDARGTSDASEVLTIHVPGYEDAKEIWKKANPDQEFNPTPSDTSGQT